MLAEGEWLIKEVRRGTEERAHSFPVITATKQVAEKRGTLGSKGGREEEDFLLSQEGMHFD